MRCVKYYPLGNENVNIAREAAFDEILLTPTDRFLSNRISLGYRETEKLQFIKIIRGGRGVRKNTLLCFVIAIRNIRRAEHYSNVEI